MKVLHIYRTYFPDPPGGLQEAIRQISLATRGFGAEPKIFTLSPDPEPRTIRFGEAEVVRSKSWAAPASCDLGGWDAFAQFRALAQWADVLHFHFPWPFADLLRMAGERHKPAVMTYHSDVVRQRYAGYVYGPLMRWMLRSMNAVVATSPAYAQTSAVLMSVVPAQRLRVIPLGIEDVAGGEPAIGHDAVVLRRVPLGTRPYFVSLGVLRYYKGLHTLIAAAPQIDANLVIAGSGPEMGRLKKQAAEAGAANVIFAGQVSNEEKAALLRGCRGLILPSHLRSEAFGMVLVEAAMFGKPLISCEIGSGTSYVNEHDVTGFVVQPECTDALATSANALVADDLLAARMGTAARLRYERMFSAPALGKAYRTLYDEAIG